MAFTSGVETEAKEVVVMVELSGMAGILVFTSDEEDVKMGGGDGDTGERERLSVMLVLIVVVVASTFLVIV